MRLFWLYLSLDLVFVNFLLYQKKTLIVAFLLCQYNNSVHVDDIDTVEKIRTARSYRITNSCP